MNKKFSLSTLILTALLLATFTFVITSAYYQNNTNRLVSEYTLKSKLFSKLDNLISTFNTHYIGQLDDNKLIDGLLTGYVYGTEDKYGEYMNAESYSELNLQNNGKNVGIGINVIENEKQIKIIGVVANSPADKNGIRIGDIIIKVGDKKVSDIGYTSAVSMLVGKEGTDAVFTILRDGEQFSYSITRELFDTSSVDFKILNTTTAYIRISEFINTTYGEYTGVMDKLKKDGIKNVVFDVRNNPGGDLNAICKVLDAILPEGTIIQIVGKDDVVQNTIKSDSTALNMKIAVLVNGNTCSAAELFSAAIKDYKKGYLIGTQTYGKGCMQTIIPLGDGSAVRVTTNRYNPPSGVNYDGIGVKPDMEVEAPVGINFYELTQKNDAQLQAAISYLSK